MKLIRKVRDWYKPAARDIHAYGGLALLGVGMWFAWQPGAFMVVGAGLLYFAFRS